MIIRDLYLKKIQPFLNKDLIKVITGIRRCGKSVMLEIIQKELINAGTAVNSILTYNFESMTLSHLRTAEALHHDVIEKAKSIKGKVYLFFDEIQEVREWEKAVNSFRIDLDCDIYITGSNSKLLSGELATYLAGRYVEFVMYPFSFREFIEQIHETQPELPLAACFKQYLIYGGMPYLAQLQYKDEPVKQYLHDLYNAIELKDIIRRKQIRDVDLLERILAYVTANAGNTFSATTISKYLKSEGRKVAPETVLFPFEPGHEEDGGDIGPDIAACRAEHLAGTCGAACEDGDADDADADVGQHGDGRVFRRQQEGDQVDDERLQGNRRLGKGQGNDQIGRNTIHSNQ